MPEQEKRLNIQMPPEMFAGTYANMASITHSDYEFTLTFARLDHNADPKTVPGIVVIRVNASPKFVKELIAALQDNYSKWEQKEEIRDLPEFPEDDTQDKSP